MPTVWKGSSEKAVSQHPFYSDLSEDLKQLEISNIRRNRVFLSNDNSYLRLTLILFCYHVFCVSLRAHRWGPERARLLSSFTPPPFSLSLSLSLLTPTQPARPPPHWKRKGEGKNQGNGHINKHTTVTHTLRGQRKDQRKLGFWVLMVHRGIDACFRGDDSLRRGDRDLWLELTLFFFCQ